MEPREGAVRGGRCPAKSRPPLGGLGKFGRAGRGGPEGIPVKITERGAQPDTQLAAGAGRVAEVIFSLHLGSTALPAPPSYQHPFLLLACTLSHFFLSSLPCSFNFSLSFFILRLPPEASSKQSEQKSRDAADKWCQRSTATLPRTTLPGCAILSLLLLCLLIEFLQPFVQKPDVFAL